MSQAKIALLEQAKIELQKFPVYATARGICLAITVARITLNAYDGDANALKQYVRIALLPHAYLSSWQAARGITCGSKLLRQSRLDWIDWMIAQYRETLPKKRAPWADYIGNALHEGDTIIHPSGDTAIVTLDPNKEDAGQWRAVYADGTNLWLGNQIGTKGMALLVKPKTESEK